MGENVIRLLVLARDEDDALHTMRLRVKGGTDPGVHYTLIWPGHTAPAAEKLFDRLIVTAMFPLHPGAARIQEAAEMRIRKVDNLGRTALE